MAELEKIVKAGCQRVRFQLQSECLCRHKTDASLLQRMQARLEMKPPTYVQHHTVLASKSRALNET